MGNSKLEGSLLRLYTPIVAASAKGKAFALTLDILFYGLSVISYENLK